MSDERNDLERRIQRIEEVLGLTDISRRQAMTGLAATLGTGALAFNAGQAEAAGPNDGDTEWGTDSNRDDYYIDWTDINRAVIGTVEDRSSGNQYDVDDLAGVSVSPLASGTTTVSSSSTSDNLTGVTDTTIWPDVWVQFDDPTSHSNDQILARNANDSSYDGIFASAMWSEFNDEWNVFLENTSLEDLTVHWELHDLKSIFS